MVSKRANPKAIGAFVLGALVIAVLGIVSFGSGQFFKDTERFVLFFDEPVKGLQIGAPVYFRGVPLGSVTDIQALYLVNEQKFLIPVLIDIDNDRIDDLENSRRAGSARV